MLLSSLWLFTVPELEPRLFSFNAPFDLVQTDGLVVRGGLGFMVLDFAELFCLGIRSLPITIHRMLEQAMIHFGVGYGPTFFRSFSRRKGLGPLWSGGIPLPL